MSSSSVCNHTRDWTNQTPAWWSSSVITDRIGLHSVLLPFFITVTFVNFTYHSMLPWITWCLWLYWTNMQDVQYVLSRNLCMNLLNNLPGMSLLCSSVVCAAYKWAKIYLSNATDKRDVHSYINLYWEDSLIFSFKLVHTCRHWSSLLSFFLSHFNFDLSLAHTVSLSWCETVGN